MLNVITPDFDNEWKRIKESFLKEVELSIETISTRAKSIKVLKTLLFPAILLGFVALALLKFYSPISTFLQSLFSGYEVIGVFCLAFLILFIMGGTVLYLDLSNTAKTLDTGCKALSLLSERLHLCDTLNDAIDVRNKWNDEHNDITNESWLPASTDTFNAIMDALENFLCICSTDILDYSCIDSVLTVEQADEDGTVYVIETDCSAEYNINIPEDTLVWRDNEIVLIEKYQRRE